MPFGALLLARDVVVRYLARLPARRDDVVDLERARLAGTYERLLEQRHRHLPSTFWSLRLLLDRAEFFEHELCAMPPALGQMVESCVVLVAGAIRRRSNESRPPERRDQRRTKSVAAVNARGGGSRSSR